MINNERINRILIGLGLIACATGVFFALMRSPTPVLVSLAIAICCVTPLFDIKALYAGGVWRLCRIRIVMALLPIIMLLATGTASALHSNPKYSLSTHERQLEAAGVGAFACPTYYRPEIECTLYSPSLMAGIWPPVEGEWPPVLQTLVNQGWKLKSISVFAYTNQKRAEVRELEKKIAAISKSKITYEKGDGDYVKRGHDINKLYWKIVVSKITRGAD